MSRLKNRLTKLLNSATLGVYLEPERKLDAEHPDILSEVENYILNDPYFELLNNNHITCDIPDGIALPPEMIVDFAVEPAHQVTTRRFRVYYDTPKLHGFRHGVEVRIEHPGPTEHGYKKPFKQVVKIGGQASPEDPTFHRMEISGTLFQSIPDFSADALDDNNKISAFLGRSFKAESFRPLQVLTTVRTRLWCRPMGFEDSIVEFGIDRGAGLTINGYKYPILQIEPELIHGNPAALGAVSEKLKDHFGNALSPNYTSKPTPGYNHLASVLDSRGRINGIKVSDLPVQSFALI